MEADNPISEKPILQSMADRLLEAQQELDELAVQLALGKAEARDKFEEIKKDFAKRLAELKITLHKNNISHFTAEISIKLDELERLLEIGKVEGREMFEKQQRLIMNALGSLEDKIKKKIPVNLDMERFIHETEKFKLKLEILRLKFVLKKFIVKEEFRSRMKIASKKIDKVMGKVKNKVEAGEEGYMNFKKDLRSAYRHLGKVVTY